MAVLNIKKLLNMPDVYEPNTLYIVVNPSKGVSNIIISDMSGIEVFPFHITQPITHNEISSVNADSITLGTINNDRLPKASTTQQGIVKIVDSVNSESIVDAASPRSVKEAYDLASTIFPAIDGFNILGVGMTSTYTITNYDVNLTYDISTIGDGDVYRNDDTIFYTAPTTPGQYGFSVNNKHFYINVNNDIIHKPTILSPKQNTKNSASEITIVTSDFLATSNLVHVSTDWQRSLTPDFSSIDYSSIGDTSNLTSWYITNLNVNTDYYFRVRYNSTNNVTSEWSNIVKVSTKQAFYPDSLESTLSRTYYNNSDYYSYSLSIDGLGNRLVVGAYGYDNVGFTNDGSAYVYIRVNNNWILETVLTPGTLSSNQYFGICVSIDNTGTRIAVGGYGYSTSRGIVYIYIRTGTTWSLEASFQAGDPTNNAYYGFSLALNDTGDRLIVGAYRFKTYRGKVYIVRRSGSTWTQEAAITSTLSQINSYFGYSVSIDSTATRVIIGSHMYSSTGYTNNGVVFIYTRSGTTWSLEATITEPTLQSTSYFGMSVDIDSTGTIAVIGAPNSNSNLGSVYIYTRSGTTWNLSQSISSPVTEPNSLFGAYVRISNNVTLPMIVVGAPGYNSNRGRCYLFTYDTTWTLASYIDNPNEQQNSMFGNSFSISKNNSSRLAVSSYLHEPPGYTDVGIGYVYTR